MKIAVFGDVHANLKALEAVLADIDAASPEKVFCHGDVVGYGASPSECLQRIRDRGYPILAGNWEHAVVGWPKGDPEKFNNFAKSSVYWSRGAMTNEEKRFISKLQEEWVEDGVHIVHGFPGEEKAFRYLMTVTDAQEAFEKAKAPVVFHGHTHIQLTFIDGNPITYIKELQFTVPEDGRALINTGAVGQPRDGDPPASYCLYDTETRTAEVRRLEYDIEKTAGKIIVAGLPEVLAKRLILGQ